MKPLILTFTLIAFFAFSLLSLSMLKSDPPPLRMRTPQMLRSIHHTEGETFTVRVEANTMHSLYVHEDFMVKHELTNQTGTMTLPIILKDYELKSANSESAHITLNYQLAIEASSEAFYINPAYLSIEYEDSTRLKLPIGEFSYHFDNAGGSTLDYTLSTPIKGDYGYGPTITGHCVGVKSSSAFPIELTGISLRSKTILPNMDYLSETNKSIHPLMDLNTLLKRPFNAKNPSVSPKHLSLKPGESTTFCIPFTYKDNLSVVRYPIEIVYLDNQREKRLLIDDFPYARTHMKTYEGVMKDGVLE